MSDICNPNESYTIEQTNSATHDRSDRWPALDANFVIDAATFETEVKNQNNSSDAEKADFKVETETANK